MPSIRRFARLILLVLAVLLSSCALKPAAEFHSFSFSGASDNWATRIEILNFAYGNKDRVIRRDIETWIYRDATRLPSSYGTGGYLAIGDYLYVKWRVKSTGQVFERRVDLKGLLPSSMKDKELTFSFDNDQLIVYILTRAAADPKSTAKTWMAKYRFAYEIYPNFTPPPGAN